MCDIATVQRDTLERLLALEREQEQAFAAGDMAALSELGEIRLGVVKGASIYLPPQQPWAPDVLGLARDLELRRTNLQRALQARLADVRRRLAQLTEGRHASEYLRPFTRGRSKGWKG